jgi:CheY-like chemotaxis protein
MAPDHRPTSVLFVDDDADERRLYADYFDGRPDISPVTVESAAQALDELARTRIDCVVTDSVVTDDGESLVEVLDRRHPDVPVLLYSGRSPATLPVDAGDGYLQKASSDDGETSMETLGRYITELLGRDRAETDDTADEWCHLGTFDPAAVDSVTTVVLEALEERTDLDVEALPPLYDTVDTDAVGRFLAHGAEAGTDDAAEARFPVADYLVRVTADGVAEYRTRGGE